MKSKQNLIPVPLLLALLAMALTVAACGGEETTTSQALTTMTQAVTTTTAAPTTTTLSEAAKLAKYRVEMKSLWDEFDSKLTAAGDAFGSIDPGTFTETQTKTAQEFSDVLSDFVTALGKIETPEDLAGAHATYVSGYQRISAALARELGALEAKNVSEVLAAASEFLTVYTDEDGSMQAAESTLEAALGFTLSPETTTTTLAVDTWSDLAPASPPPACHYGSMVYDSARRVAFHFGGELVDGYSNSTWAYDPAPNTWTELKPSGAIPTARCLSAAAYDPVGGRIILFGGAVYDQDKDEMLRFNDTWAYDPATNTWTEVKPSGTVPSVRSGTSMVYDPGSKKMVLFGGGDGKAVFNDTWTYDPAENRWTKLKPSGSPSKRERFATDYDPVRRAVLLFGGEGMEGYLNDTWSYDPAANAWTELKQSGTTPTARFGSAMVHDPASNRFILFGGGVYASRLDMECFNDTWSYDPAANAWTELKQSGTIPAARFGSAMVHAPVPPGVILFGGATVNLNAVSLYDDTWSFYPGK